MDDHRQGAGRRRRCPRRARRPRCPTHQALDQRGVAVGEGVRPSRRPAPTASRTTVQPSAEPPRAGFTISGSPTEATIAVHHGGGAELAERLVRQRRRRPGCADAGPGHHRLGDRLVEGRAAGRRAGRRRRAARPARAPRGPRRPRRSRRAAAGRTQSGGSSRSTPEQVGVHVAHVDLGAGLAQRLGDPAPGAQRDVALVGQPAGEHDDAQRRGPRLVEPVVGGVVDRRSAASLTSGPSSGPSYPRLRCARGRAGAEAGAEGVPQLDLLLDHADQPAHALADPLGGGVAVGQPHALRAEAVGEERGARARTRPASVTARGSIALASRPGGQGQPDVEAAGRDVPPRGRRASCRRARRPSRRAARGTSPGTA